MACKNLFLRNKRGEYFWLTLPADKRADLNLVAKCLNLSRLSFASEEELEKILDLHAGAVTPLEIINDDTKKNSADNQCRTSREKFLLRLDTNTAIIAAAFADLPKLIFETEHNYLLVEL